MTTQVQAKGGRTFATAGTTASSPALTDSANSFTNADIGRTVTVPNVPAGTTILSVQSAGSCTMSANATALGTGVSCTISPMASVVTDSVQCVLPSTPLGAPATPALSPDATNQVLQALNVWRNCAGTGAWAAWASSILSAFGFNVQEI